MPYDESKLKRARELKGWTKSMVAKSIKVTPRVVWDVENGDNQSPRTIFKMAKVLGLQMEEIWVEERVAR